MFYKSFRIIFLGLIISQFFGCAAAVVATGATGVAVVNDRRTTGTVIEDESIELEAGKLFWQDKEINDNAHINVTSYNMVVLVTGEAPTEEIRQKIINLVKGIRKVTKVYDELTIAAPSSMVSRSSDTVITSKVKTKLLTLDNVDGSNIKVVTEKGVVYLMGLIKKQEADLATDAVRQVGGVQKVVKLFQYTD